MDKRFKILFFLLISLALFFQVSCAVGIGVATTFVDLSHINGIVTEAGTNKPIPGVRVSARDYTWFGSYTYDRATTGARGEYQLDLASGTYDIYFVHNEYHDVIYYDIVIFEPFSRSLNASLKKIE
ncbi:MAG: carboxypeptidase regulatory-like domain-containing protein [Vulcanimicrobiota bacterium]